MLTYSFEEKGTLSLYEYLYQCIKEDIRQHKLKSGKKLPSKRNLAKNLNISVITVESAYSQLMLEGYIYSIERKGYFVSAIDQVPLSTRPNPSDDLEEMEKNPGYFADFSANSISHEYFPFSIWSKIMRDILSYQNENLLKSAPPSGVYELRKAIADHLYHFRGMSVSPTQIIIGAGTEYLYSLLIQLIGRDQIYAVENPGYRKTANIFKSNGVRCRYINIDEYGMSATLLLQSDANVIHISPAHHFPTGIVMPVKRRQELLNWSMNHPSRYIIEDDYDCEFRFYGKPIQTLQSTDSLEKVIYLNTFTKTLAPSFRISYMVLPKHLVWKFHRELSFYSCTVPNFEQYALAEFIDKGYYDKHINRMRNYYRLQRNRIIQAIKSSSLSPYVTILEENAGLHFLIKVETSFSDTELVENTKKEGIKISCLSEYYHSSKECENHILIINYSGIPKDDINEAIGRLALCIFKP